jgi:hypothetical protein
MCASLFGEGRAGRALTSGIRIEYAFGFADRISYV